MFASLVYDCQRTGPDPVAENLIFLTLAVTMLGSCANTVVATEAL